MKIIIYILSVLMLYIGMGAWFRYFVELGIKDVRYWIGAILMGVMVNLFMHVVKNYLYPYDLQTQEEH